MMEQKAGITSIQIQPHYSDREAWRALAGRERCSFEVLELSVPGALNDPEFSDVCRKWYQDSGLAASFHGAFIDVNPGSGDEGFRALSRERCRQSCALAASLGAKNVVFHSSCFPFLRGDYLDFWAGTCAGFYEELAGEWNLNIFIENSPDIDAVPIRTLMRRITDTRIGVCLDLGHANYSRMRLEDWFEQLQDWIGYLHLSDNEGRDDTHLPLGQGSVDWGLADALFRQMNRFAYVTVETNTLQDTEVSLAYLKEHHYFGA